MLIRTASLVLPHEQARPIDPVDRKLIARLPTRLTVSFRDAMCAFRAYIVLKPRRSTLEVTGSLLRA
jgi:hypothetical protein